MEKPRQKHPTTHVLPYLLFPTTIEATYSILIQTRFVPDQMNNPVKLKLVLPFAIFLMRTSLYVYRAATDAPSTLHLQPFDEPKVHFCVSLSSGDLSVVASFSSLSIVFAAHTESESPPFLLDSSTVVVELPLVAAAAADRI